MMLLIFLFVVAHYCCCSGLNCSSMGGCRRRPSDADSEDGGVGERDTECYGRVG